MKKLAALLALTLSLSLGATPAKAIVFGEDVLSASTQYPWVASVWFSGPNDDQYYNSICTGSLIAPDVVLTAAHCILNSGTYYVQMGSDTLGGADGPTFYEVDAVWKNPRYGRKKLINDVGLLKLTTPQTTVAPMQFATKKDTAAIKKTKTFEILGWGQNQAGEKATYLRYTKVSEQRQAARSFYTSKYFNENTMIAAGRYLKKEKVYTGACRGDSGGPLVAKIRGVSKIVGITSYGGRSCNTKAPTVFSNVAYYEKDLAKGMATLRRSALVDNRAMPSIVSEPSISAATGSVTCNPGSWSSNTTQIQIQWTAPYSILRSTNPSVAIPTRSFSDTKYTCLVTGRNANGKISREVSITIPASPYSYLGPTIEGVGLSITPTLGQTLTCSPPAWEKPGVTNSFTWYASASALFDINSAQVLGEGDSLVMSEEVEAATVGRNWIHCRVVGSNAGGSTSMGDYVFVNRPFKR
jgi:secreted trypsin-like serine protease